MGSSALSGIARQERDDVSPFPSRRTVISAERVSKRMRWASMVVAVIAVTGLLVFMYPSTAAWWSQYHESKAIIDYQDEVKADPPPGNALQLEKAREYNQRLSTGDVVVGADSHKPVLLGEERDDSGYWSILPSKTGMMARLKIQSIDVDLPIYHGTSDAVEWVTCKELLFP